MLVIELDDSLDVAFVVAGKTGQLQDGVDIHEAGMSEEENTTTNWHL